MSRAQHQLGIAPRFFTMGLGTRNSSERSLTSSTDDPLMLLTTAPPPLSSDQAAAPSTPSRSKQTRRASYQNATGTWPTLVMESAPVLPTSQASSSDPEGPPIAVITTTNNNHKTTTPSKTPSKATTSPSAAGTTMRNKSHAPSSGAEGGRISSPLQPHYQPSSSNPPSSTASHRSSIVPSEADQQRRCFELNRRALQLHQQATKSSSKSSASSGPSSGAIHWYYQRVRCHALWSALYSSNQNTTTSFHSASSSPFGHLLSNSKNYHQAPSVSSTANNHSQNSFASLSPPNSPRSNKGSVPKEDDINADIQILELSCLDGLRCEQDGFLPHHPVMVVPRHLPRQLDRVTASPWAPDERRILTGSAGVGKSMVLLLAALKLAAGFTSPSTTDAHGSNMSSSGDSGTGQRVVLLRRTAGEAHQSVFVLEGVGGSSSAASLVDVFFCRTVSKFRMSLSQLATYTLNLMNLEAEDCLWCIDGPSLQDAEQTLHGAFHLLCPGGDTTGLNSSAGGLSMMIRQEEYLNTQMIMVDGWHPQDLIRALPRLLPKVTLETAQAMSEFAGGSIRLALAATTSKLHFNKTKEWLDSLIMAYQFYTQMNDKLTLPVVYMQGPVPFSLPPAHQGLQTLWTHYSHPTQPGVSVAVMDSHYVIRKLSEQLDTTMLMDGFQTLQQAELLSCCGGAFWEEVMHRWFEVNLPAPIKQAFRCSLNNKSKVPLPSLGTYWIPALSSYASIDAAMVLPFRNDDGNLRLVCLQYTTTSQTVFDRENFWARMGCPARARFSNLTHVEIWFIVPLSVEFALSREHVPYEEAYLTEEKLGGGILGLAPNPDASTSSTVHVSFHVASVDLLQLTPERFAFLSR